ncbi:hypothetical protein, variant [Saprolegnia diclina VS20]|uniref:Uncharacterized protein n=1 Tax=Saprolegnia diclina (strain VS20) TaxID=1156394 RepID=T0QZH2_SAPDV|nr:hypothetical protein SDRG_16975 [Saprolegnia diclina VS20]XP_008621430.1 hypothetical protein, variant [Saprolegnia diclina VS20]EQC25147.1 hypothetical protein SDRG_16975 [Saprolegnia diclina VS20]EQC25148.1 hypothetical protein, variant [Saprolegnia diclina VS20]|eukprot:XP_008621429.1 hypothetical protein SDRG_16975 [Saprolegnia diclina VS20]
MTTAIEKLTQQSTATQRDVLNHVQPLRNCAGGLNEYVQLLRKIMARVTNKITYFIRGLKSQTKMELDAMDEAKPRRSRDHPSEVLVLSIPVKPTNERAGPTLPTTNPSDVLSDDEGTRLSSKKSLPLSQMKKARPKPCRPPVPIPTSEPVMDVYGMVISWTCTSPTMPRTKAATLQA